LNKGERHDVHLSPDAATAKKVGQRRGRPVVLKIRAGEMYRGGHVFRHSANNVWLVDFVPAEFIEFEQ
jgi:putative RNA 2'-phosphotransferase